MRGCLAVGVIAICSGVFVGSSYGTQAKELVFIGCRPSVGECSMSCAERNGISVYDASLCADTELEPIACYCPN